MNVIQLAISEVIVNEHSNALEEEEQKKTI